METKDIIDIGVFDINKVVAAKEKKKDLTQRTDRYLKGLYKKVGGEYHRNFNNPIKIFNLIKLGSSPI
jgi:hypothetical protein